MISSKMFVKTHNELMEYINETELKKSLSLGNQNSSVYFKLESSHKYAGSYKIRGALAKLLSLSDEEKKKGITAISSGNHGAALAYSGYLLGVKNTEIFVPSITPDAKTDKMKSFGAKVNYLGNNYDETHSLAPKVIRDGGLIEVEPCEDLECIKGYGTIALEILKENDNIDVILVPIGGGGLITGISMYCKVVNPNIKIIGVQTSASPAMRKSIDDGICYEYYESEESVCEALIGGIGKLPYKYANELIDDVILVSEKNIAEATIDMYEKEDLLCEPSSATVYAAYKEYYKEFENKSVVLVVTGSNTSFDTINKLRKMY